MDQAVHEFHALTRHRYEQLVGDSTRRLLPPESMLMSAEELQAALSGRPRVTCLTGPAGLAPEAHPLDCTLAPPVPAGAAADAPSRLAAQLRDWPGRVLLTCETAGRHEVLREALGRHGVDLSPVERWQDFLDGEMRRGIAISTLDEDMVLGDSAILILCEARIFGERAAQRRHRRARDPQAIIRSLAQLQLGDAVVHEDHGVGRYRGLATITASGIEAEFLCVEYHGGDKLYVPVLALER
jgi:transcription-repair coupling factor (superfamily II helicase)